MLVPPYLKPKEPRLRDWNTEANHHQLTQFPLKPKEPRLRDWNGLMLMSKAVSTLLKPKEPRLRDWNKAHPSRTGRRWWFETKRTSITRLKLHTSWNMQRYQDIETKRTSITRLKQMSESRIGKTLSVAWNQKNLDYEIETLIPAATSTR